MDLLGASAPGFAMSSINNLSEAGTFSLSMQVPVYDTGNGQPRKVSGQQMLDTFEASLSGEATGAVVPFGLASYSVAELPSAVANPQAIVYCTNGNAGVACLAVSNGTSWLRIALGAAVSAT